MRRSVSGRLRTLHLVLLAALFALLAVPADAQWVLRSCSTSNQNLFVRDVMRDLYFWSSHVPNLDAARYASPEAYLDAARYKTLDTTFSYITSRAANEAFYSDSQFIGFGLSTQTTLVGEDEASMRVSQVFADSPASEATLKRGDRILRVGGMSITEWWRAGRLGEAFGPGDMGYETTIVFQRGDADAVEARMTKRLVTIPTVSDSRVIDLDGRKIGYVFFRNFVTPSTAALDDAFADFKRAGVDELVLDVRYNGGGLVSVAQHLGALIGGLKARGQVFGEYFHNDRNAFRNSVMRFDLADQALTLDRVFVITTRASASASELVINALRPFMPVVTIGEPTYGKPVGQYGIEFCEKVLAPVSFTIRNANGEGDYFAGLPATCPAADDLDHQLADVQEGSLAEALHYVAHGACSTSTEATTRSLLRRPRIVSTERTGWQQLIGAR